mmetsp:Transcript_50957/g.143429  ORF Transcript_50957/g.143429 Transcript_50957/m.143429 type:complete len:279 (-) Transcript_50957:23-859(-)
MGQDAVERGDPPVVRPVHHQVPDVDDEVVDGRDHVDPHVVARLGLQAARVRRPEYGERAVVRVLRVPGGRRAGVHGGRRLGGVVEEAQGRVRVVHLVVEEGLVQAQREGEQSHELPRQALDVLVVPGAGVAQSRRVLRPHPFSDWQREVEALLGVLHLALIVERGGHVLGALAHVAQAERRRRPGFRFHGQVEESRRLGLHLLQEVQGNAVAADHEEAYGFARPADLLGHPLLVSPIQVGRYVDDGDAHGAPRPAAHDPRRRQKRRPQQDQGPLGARP